MHHHKFKRNYKNIFNAVSTSNFLQQIYTKSSDFISHEQPYNPPLEKKWPGPATLYKSLKLYPYVHSRKFNQEFLCNFNAVWHQIFFKKPMHKAQPSLAMNNLIICLHSRRSGQGPLCTRVLPTWACLGSEGERAKGYTLNLKHQDSHKGGATPAKKLRSK